MHIRAHGTEQKEPGCLSLTQRPTVNAVTDRNRDVTAGTTARRSDRLRCASRICIKRFVEENGKQALMRTGAEPLGEDIRKLLGSIHE